MTQVVLADPDSRTLAGGAERLETAAPTVGALIAELERRHPGLGEHVRRRTAVVIDGEIHQDALAASLTDAREVCLIPRIGGG